MSRIKSFVIQCIERARGDNLYRAQMAFKGLSATEMQKQYGESGRTRQAIIDGHRDHHDMCDAAIEEVRAELN